jgi:hypothetical protein
MRHLASPDACYNKFMLAPRILIVPGRPDFAGTPSTPAGIVQRARIREILT